MDDQRFVVIQIEENVFAATMNKTDRGSGQPLGKFVGRRFGREPGSNKSGLRYAAPADKIVQGRRD
jgi:hypothetical protein